MHLSGHGAPERSWHLGRRVLRDHGKTGWKTHLEGGKTSFLLGKLWKTHLEDRQSSFFMGKLWKTRMLEVEARKAFLIWVLSDCTSFPP